MPYKLEDIKSIFLNKIPEWEYEDEYRIIAEKQCYIDIKIKKLIFGIETSQLDKELISQLIKKIDSSIKIETYNG